MTTLFIVKDHVHQVNINGFAASCGAGKFLQLRLTEEFKPFYPLHEYIG